MATVSQAAPDHAAPWHTHDVFNQVPPLEGVNLFSSNVALVEAVEREGAGWVADRHRIGDWLICEGPARLGP